MDYIVSANVMASLSIVSVIVLFVVILVVCKGEKGEKGEKGDMCDSGIIQASVSGGMRCKEVMYDMEVVLPEDSPHNLQSKYIRDIGALVSGRLVFDGPFTGEVGRIRSKRGILTGLSTISAVVTDEKDNSGVLTVEFDCEEDHGVVSYNAHGKCEDGHVDNRHTITVSLLVPLELEF